MKAWLPPTHYERRYGRFMVKTAQQVRRELLARLRRIVRLKTLTFNEEFNDDFYIRSRASSDTSDEIAIAIGATLLWWAAYRLTLSPTIQGYFSITSKFNDNQFREVIKSLSGIDLPPSAVRGYVSGGLFSSTQDILKRFGDKADAYRLEPYFEQIETNWEAIQETYINKTIVEVINDTELIVRNGIAISAVPDAILNLIDKKFETVEKRFTQSGSDQIHSLDTQLTQKRQQSLGFDEYIWETRRDERVRGNPNGLYPKAKPSHFARQSVVFNWNEPPEGGHPGEAPGCRCRALIRMR